MFPRAVCLSGAECRSRTLSGNWKCLCFTGVRWQRRDRLDGAKFVFDCAASWARGTAAALRLTDNALVAPGVCVGVGGGVGGGAPTGAPESC